MANSSTTWRLNRGAPILARACSDAAERGNQKKDVVMSQFASAGILPNPLQDEMGSLRFPVAGVGASAGGLEAYSELLDGLSTNPGLALLLVSHLDPEQKSHLAPILSRVSRMPVLEATEGMAVEVDGST